MTLSYPEKPTEEVKKRMASIIKGFSLVYACKICREDFQKEIASDPPKLDSRNEFATGEKSFWLPQCQKSSDLQVFEVILDLR